MNDEQKTFRIQYAQRNLDWLRAGAEKGKEPWRKAQHLCPRSNTWRPLADEPTHWGKHDYRWAPRSNPVINGVTISGQIAVDQLSEFDEAYWLNFAVDNLVARVAPNWCIGHALAKQGVLFATEGEARTAAVAIIAALGGEV